MDDQAARRRAAVVGVAIASVEGLLEANGVREIGGGRDQGLGGRGHRFECV